MSCNIREIEKMIVALDKYNGDTLSVDGIRREFPAIMISSRLNDVLRRLDSIKSELKSISTDKNNYEDHGYYHHRHIQKSGANVYCVDGGWSCFPNNESKRTYKTPDECYQSENW